MWKGVIKPAYLFAALFLFVVSFSVAFDWLPLLVLNGYLLLSLISFVLYAWDKAVAKKASRKSANRRRRRISENSLHISALLGGWPGALVAQQWLRHKTVKQPFRTVFWLTIILNLLFFAWFYSPTGNRILGHLHLWLH